MIGDYVMAKYCTKCGTPLDDNIKFCPNCGAAIAAPAPAQQNVTQSQLAPIGQIFAIAGIGASIKDLAASGKDIWKNGYNSLDAKSKEDLAMQTVRMLAKMSPTMWKTVSAKKGIVASL